MKFYIVTESLGAVSKGHTTYTAMQALERLHGGATWAEDVDTGDRYDEAALTKLIKASTRKQARKNATRA